MEFKEAWMPHLEEWDMSTLTQRWDRMWEKWSPYWRGKQYEGLRPLCERLDALIERKGLIFTGALSIKQIIAWHNYETNFAEFDDQAELKSMNPGFGGSGGQIMECTRAEDGTMCYRPTTVADTKVEYWQKCEPRWFATHFCTFEQWRLIASGLA